MPGSINMDTLIGVTPSVLSSGGTALDLIALVLTNNPRVPVGEVLSMPPSAVSGYFGPSSDEALDAATYEAGYTNSTMKPGLIMFAQYPPAPVSAYLRGGTMSGVTLAQLQAYGGSFSVPVDGVAKAAVASVSLAAATSWSGAAAILTTAIGAPVSYDSIAQSFVVTSTTTGVSSSLAFATGSLAVLLNMTSATGALISNGAAAGVPGAVMDAVLDTTRDFATFTTSFEPTLSDKLLFAAWNSAQNNKFLYVPWDSDQQSIVPNSTEPFGVALQATGYSGTSPVYTDKQVAMMICGLVASIDFTETQGRVNAAYKSSTALTPSVTSSFVATTLQANGYNYYGNYSTAEEKFEFLFPGTVSGPFGFIDSYVNQIWLNSQLQLALTVLETTVKSIPYNQPGYDLMEAALQDPISAAVLFGAIQPNVPLSAAQALEVDNSAGIVVSPILSTRGWYLQILAASAQVRGVRGSPPCKFWYMDGGSVQSIMLNSVEVQ
jgi:hypothetical protein